MKKDLRKLIKEVSNGKNLEMNLPKYVRELNGNYYEMSLINVTLDYYTLYEVVEMNEVASPIQKSLESINKIIKLAFIDTFDATKIKEGVAFLEEERNRTMKAMDVLTSYTDKLEIYEYALNRMEKKFEQDLEVESELGSEQGSEVESELDSEQDYGYDIPLQPTNDDEWVRYLMTYICSVDDMMIVNNNIKEVIQQLPVRMARSRYFELIRNTLSNYRGADKSALDRYLYMLKSAAMISNIEGQGNYFTEYKQWFDELEGLDYNNLNGNSYKRLIDSLGEHAEFMERLMDCYLSLQEIVNHLYVYLLSMPYQMGEEKKEMTACKEIVVSLYEMFQAPPYEMVSGTLAGKLIMTEGIQEKGYEEKELLESVLEEVRINYTPLCQSLMLQSQLEGLVCMNLLMSNDHFIELEKKEEETAEADYVEAVTEELIEEVKALFQKNKPCINRAVIAHTFSILPIFFQSIEEVTNYIRSSLEQCQDIGEKKVSLELLFDLTLEDYMYDTME